MEKYRKKLVEGYKKYTGSEGKVHINPEALGTTLSKSDFEEPYNIDKYVSFVGQSMWYTIKVGPDVANTSRELAVHMIHHGTEHWKALRCLVRYVKGKDTKGTVIRNTKVPKAVMLCDLNFAT